MQKTYVRADFQILFDRCFPEHKLISNGVEKFIEITDEGVFYDAWLLELGGVTKCLRWKFHHELSGLEKPPSTGPALTFPFTAEQLAAFMLDGLGLYFQYAFGLFEEGPIKSVEIGGHEDDADAYEALRQAYRTYKQAQIFVKKCDSKLQLRAQELRQQLDDAITKANEQVKLWELGISEDERRVRRERAKAFTADLEAEAKAVTEEADAAYKSWRKSVVHQLLGFHKKPASTEPETVAQRHARRLKMFEAEEKRQPYGSLQRLANAEGVDRSNLQKDLKKARKARDEQNRAGTWTGQLVRRGK